MRVHYLCYFFFSSRRRHTRSKRDWSSDVCSSISFRSGLLSPLNFLPNQDSAFGIFLVVLRSEERRVGKECRSRWAEGHVKKERRRQGEQDLSMIDTGNTKDG